MIEVDISHIWGGLSLPELLAEEKRIFAAHEKIASQMPDLAELLPETEIEKIYALGEKIRNISEACVVIGGGLASIGAKGIIELFQGTDCNLGKKKGDPQIFFAGNSFSTRQWNQLQQLLEGKAVSVIALEDRMDGVESAVALRSIRFLLERRYGTDEASQRIYAAAFPEDSLHCLARQLGWQHILLPDTILHGLSVLTGAGLLPLAVAGLDIRRILQGAKAAREQYDLRSFENPVWLHAGVRNALYNRGRRVEVLVTREPNLRGLSKWWQQLFAAGAGKTGGGMLPVPAEFPAEQNAMGLLLRQSQCPVLETVLTFSDDENDCIVISDAQNVDGLEPLVGKSLSWVDAMANQVMLDDHEDAGAPVITMDCGVLNEEKVGELLGFFQLSCGISGYSLNLDSDALLDGGITGEQLLSKLGCDSAGDDEN